MASVGETLALALQYHRAGDLEQAERLYRQIVEFDPHFADAHHLLGLLAYQAGRHEAAIALMRHALSLKPTAPHYYSNLGLAQEALSQFEDAEGSYREAIRLNSNFAEAYCNLGNVLSRRGKHTEAMIQYSNALSIKPNYAEAHCGLGTALSEAGMIDQALVHLCQALWLQPNYVEAHFNLANALFAKGRVEEAASHYEEALRMQPGFFEAHCHLGNTLVVQGKIDEGIQHYREALRLNPAYAEAHYRLGGAFMEQDKLDEAQRCYEKALSLNPQYAEAHNNLGTCLELQNQLGAARRCYEHALGLQPNYAMALANLGNVYKSTGQFDAAMQHYETALRLDPSSAKTHLSRSIICLLRGDWGNGWPEYEWRLQVKDALRCSFSQPRWDGSPLAGRTLLVVTEQGRGDTFQFIRLVPLLKQRQRGRILLLCRPSVCRVLADSLDKADLVAENTALPPFDVYVPLISLAGLLGISPTDTFGELPYLRTDPKLVDFWRRELEFLAGFKVGIAWQGSRKYRFDAQRSIPLTNFQRLAHVPGVRLLSLQKGLGAEQLEQHRQFSTLTYQPRGLDEAAGAFRDTAAIMQNLDLVICSDSAVAHLAGGLGVPVWVAQPFVPDWRWLLERADSPWYASMRLFRQTSMGSWQDVFDRIGAELEKFCQTPRSLTARPNPVQANSTLNHDNR